MSQATTQRGGRQPVPTKQELATATPESRVKEYILARGNELTSMLGGDKDRFKRLAAIAVNAWRKLDDARKQGDAEINTYSLMEAIAFSAMLGLDAGSDQVYLVPYKGKIQPIISPRGLMDLAYGSELVIAVEARCVLQGDAFDYDNGTESFIKHKKGTSRPRTNKDRAEVVTHAYAFMRIVRGSREATIQEVLPKDDIEFYRSFSQARSGPWFDNYEGMARKTALKRLFPNGPRAPMLELALHEDSHGVFMPPADWRERLERAIGPAQKAPALEQDRRINGGVGEHPPEVHARAAENNSESAGSATVVDALTVDELKKIDAMQADTVGSPITAPEKGKQFVFSVRSIQGWPAARIDLAVKEAQQRLADAEEEAQRMGGGD